MGPINKFEDRLFACWTMMTGEEFDKFVAEHDAKYKHERISDEMMAFVRAVQDAADAMLKLGITLTEIEVKEMPDFSKARPRAKHGECLEVLTIAGVVRTREKNRLLDSDIA